jgi:hypothetical protein
MTTQNLIITLICSIISGVLATSITLYVNHRSEIRRIKRELVADIFGRRFLLNKNEGTEKFYEALNRVPIIFNKDQKVMETYEALYNASLITDVKEKSHKMNNCLVSFLKALCDASGIDCGDWNDSKVLDVFG